MKTIIQPLQNDPLNECLDCHHQGQEWAEDSNDNNETAEVYCPQCGSVHYYIKDEVTA